MEISRISVFCLASAILLTGLAILFGNPLDSKLMAWVWVAWALIGIIQSLTAKNLKNWW